MLCFGDRTESHGVKGALYRDYGTLYTILIQFVRDQVWITKRVSVLADYVLQKIIMSFATIPIVILYFILIIFS